jgi:ABC-type multidrug transport system fused ATPase/permease subunit
MVESVMQRQDSLKSLYSSIISLLDPKAIKRLGLATLVQIAGGLLDLIGVGLFGILGALAVSGVQSQSPTGRVQQILQLMKIENHSIQSQATILAILATGILIVRSIFSIVFTRKIILFLSKESAKLSISLTSRVLNQDVARLQRYSLQELIFATSHGVRVVLVGILGNTIVLISDLSLVLIMLAGLLYVDPLIALSTTVCFGAVGALLYKYLHVRSRQLGELESKLDIKASSIFQQVFLGYRESFVLGRRSLYVDKIRTLRIELANALAEISFIPQISKYVVESTVLLGLLLVGALQFSLQDAPHAVATLSVMLAASTRIAPAVLRAQQGAVQIKGSFGYAKPTLDLIAETKNLTELEPQSAYSNYGHEGFSPIIHIEEVSYVYPDTDLVVLNEVTFQIQENEFVAIVGPSGAGKTTLVDLILGLLTPKSGNVCISQLSPSSAIRRWPGAIGYVPQNVNITNESLYENVAMGIREDKIDILRARNALSLAQVKFLKTDDGFFEEGPIGENGGKLSGGERQRIGIARALYTSPKILILDEATSALDGKTENEIGLTLNELKKSTTIIVIAHRLSTIRNADKVAYLDQGRLLAYGTLAEVRKSVPEFDIQANQMGL